MKKAKWNVKIIEKKNVEKLSHTLLLYIRLTM